MSAHLIVVSPLDVGRGRRAEPRHARQVDSRAAVHVHVWTAKDFGVRLCANGEPTLLSSPSHIFSRLHYYRLQAKEVSLYPLTDNS